MQMTLPIYLLTLLSLFFGQFAQAADKMRLWESDAPGATGSAEKDIPTLTPYLPAEEKQTGCVIIVCPGGGYGHLAVGHEGEEIGNWLRANGIAAFVLEYRHSGKGYKHPAPLNDAQRAIRLVRSKADSFGVDVDRIGILGFSAGGHLASSAGTHFDAGNPAAQDSIDRVSCRPDFMILCYPVIAFDQPFTHKGSQRNLLGADAPRELVQEMSSELQVTAETPPTFLFHTTADTGVPPLNSVVFYTQLVKHKVPAEMHVFEKGRHGVGLARDLPGTSRWPELCIEWLRARDMLSNN